MIEDVGGLLASQLLAEVPGAHLSWGEVTHLSPLRVRRLGETAPVNVTSTVDKNLTVGQRVILAQQGTQLIVVSSVALPPPPPPSPIIPNGANLNDYQEAGQWYQPTSANVATFVNGPPGSRAGTLVVMKSSGVVQFWHDFNTQDNGITWRRRMYQTTWSDWEYYAGGGVPVSQWFTLANGWTTPSGWPVRIRAVGPIVHMTGLATPPSGLTTNVTSIILSSISPSLRPTNSIRFTASAHAPRGAVGMVEVSSGGNISYMGTLWSAAPTSYINMTATWLRDLP